MNKPAPVAGFFVRIGAPVKLHGFSSADLRASPRETFRDFERHDRIRPVEFDGSVLDVYTLGNEDLAITKLLSWRGDKDRRDLENMWSNGSINHSALNSILLDITEVRINITEAQWNLLNQRIAVLDGRDPFSSDTSTTFGFPSFSPDDQPSPELDAPHPSL